MVFAPGIKTSEIPWQLLKVLFSP